MYLMVLEDGETYTQLKGCKIIIVDDAFEESPDLDYIVKAIYNDDMTNLAQYGKSVGWIVTEFK